MIKIFRILLLCVIAVAGFSCKGTPEAVPGVIDTIMSRRSVRKYLDAPVEHEKLAQIAFCGINAPSAMNEQPWEVRVVEDPSFVSELTDLFVKEYPDSRSNPDFKTMFNNAPNVIFVATPEDGGLLDAGMLAENIMLSAESMGLGTCCQGWTLDWLLGCEDAAPYLSRLEIPEGYVLRYLIGVGYPDETPAPTSRKENKIRYILPAK